MYTQIPHFLKFIIPPNVQYQTTSLRFWLNFEKKRWSSSNFCLEGQSRLLLVYSELLNRIVTLLRHAHFYLFGSLISWWFAQHVFVISRRQLPGTSLVWVKITFNREIQVFICFRKAQVDEISLFAIYIFG